MREEENTGGAGEAEVKGASVSGGIEGEEGLEGGETESIERGEGSGEPKEKTEEDESNLLSYTGPALIEKPVATGVTGLKRAEGGENPSVE